MMKRKPLSLLNGLICFEALTRLDFGDAFCNGLRLLCTGPHAEVLTNSVVSKLEPGRYWSGGVWGDCREEVMGGGPG